MTTIDTFQSAAAMAQALREKKISSAELIEAHFEQIGRHNPALNAVVIFNYPAAREAAQQADAARARGEDAPLLGVPFTVKDWIEVEGWRSTAGDPRLAESGYVAKTDSRVAARLKAAGAIVLGKTNMAPWGGEYFTANEVFGRSNNPWDLERTPGGSTGGGAAAVAAGMTPLEIGNDIGGSVRLPPAFCGVYGHRPSETAWPRTGQTPDESGRHLPNPVSALAVMGPLARSAEDLALALDLAAGPDQGEDTAWRLELPRARHERLADFRVAVLPRLGWLPVDDEIWAAQERLVGELSRMGAKVSPAAPAGFGDGLAYSQLYWQLMIAQTLGQLSPEKRKEIVDYYKVEAPRRGDPLMGAGGEVFAAWVREYLVWFFRREEYRAAFRDFFREWDVLLTPMTNLPAFRHADIRPGTDSDDWTLPVNGQPFPYLRLGVYPGVATLVGHPATAFPFGKTRAGLPIGLQAVGPYLEDHTAIRFAGLVGEALGGYERPPL